MSETLEVTDHIAPAPSEVTVNHEVDKPEVTQADEQQAADPAAQPDKTPAWMQRKIDKMTYERREAERQASAAREELEQMRRALAASRGEEPTTEPLTEDQIRQQERQRLDQQATEERAVATFNQNADKIAKAVAASHGDEAVTNATRMLIERGGLDFANATHRDLLADISELPDPGAVYYALAHDPDTAASILDASPRKQGALLAQFAASVGKSKAPAPSPAPAAVAPAVSKTPAPVSAPSGAATKGSRSLYDPNISAAEFDRLWKAGVRT